MKLHICNGCGEEEMLDEGVRHWHDCHPAHFSFIVKSDKQLISQMVGAFQQGLHPTKGIRPAKKALSKPKHLSAKKVLPSPAPLRVKQ